MQVTYKIKLKTVMLFIPMISVLTTSSLYAESNKNLDNVTKTKIKSVNITIPKPPKVVSPIILKIGGVNRSNGDRSIQFSKRMPPNYLTSKERYAKGGKGVSQSSSDKMVGEVDKGRISAYLRAPIVGVETARNKLKDVGFEIVKTAHLTKSRSLVSIVFTNDALKKLASKNGRGFVGTLRLLYDRKNKQISITNPVYLTKAMLQDDYNQDEAKKLLSAIVKAFPDAKGSMDKLKFQLLPKYQFMNGMPYYKDIVVVAHGDNLLSKLSNNKRVLYSIKLNNGATLVGVKLGKRTRKFTKKIGVKNAAMLPYPLIIENGEAKVLDPKYYLSLMYPQLTMEEFMTIATIPEAIIKDCTRVFR